MGELDSYGCAVLPRLLSAEECRSVAALYPDESHFRSHVIIAHCKSTSGLDNSSMASGSPSLSQKVFNQRSAIARFSDAVAMVPALRLTPSCTVVSGKHSVSCPRIRLYRT